MARGDKFINLRNHFHNCETSSLTLTFDEIEKILGIPLSTSAYMYSAYWSQAPTHTLPDVWIDEGYTLKHLDIINRKATWCRNEKEAVISPESTPTNSFHNNISVATLFSLSPEVAGGKVQTYYQEIQSGENGRYLSWEHCYSFFAKHRNQPLDKEHLDLLCLHLAFYLASWGMYRGSSFLLQRDYLVHRDAIIEIFSVHYLPLWGVTSESLLQAETLDLLFELVKKIEAIYVEKRADIDGRSSVSETLLTKILLGTLGCVPAYDRYFVTAIRKHKIASGQFSKKSILNLAQFHLQNKAAFSSCIINTNGIDYPPMKIIDMCFWQIGYESEDASEPEQDQPL